MGGQTDPDSPGDSCLSFLLINDEWSPTRGGISTFNRLLATALANAGCRTACLVEHATPRDREDAAERGVNLVVAERTPAGPNLYVRAEQALRTLPDVVVGHDRVSGSVAWTYARRYRRTRLVHIVHTAPSEIEPYKSGEDAPRRIAQRERMTRDIAADADVVAAVGPRLRRNAEAVVCDGFGGVPVLQLDPGLTVPAGLDGRMRRALAEPTVLVLGRTGDIELKGLDIAAKATAGLTVPTGQPKPVLYVRGAPGSECASLHGKLVAMSGAARDRIDVRAFTDDPDELGQDLKRASLSIIPSRVEGFGMAALDAISLGTPLLVSSKAGIAETLRQHLGSLAGAMIVETDDTGEDVARWKAAINRILSDREKAFHDAHEIRRRLIGVLSWERTVDKLLCGLSPRSLAS
ncbi:Glycosyltransferase involved in cell wall bisynthesis [Amycolatopsis xylanica]|uniref:Glycosyltransferase involved in cell wall bisynthesis n=1 Tax=Amycolatopsis xylanica TaxID=589385 RepID=A0A1H3Q650_9PSEU|nr:glycosyltransferase family 4 protein [Amycolatopsis xylanica]SDZ08740.1 Glycosyltransferase involved in cell wall bisynthesis [Amycolatopsis xylanica]